MKGEFIPEPELEFGGGDRHLDIRFGLTDYGPLDTGVSAPSEVKLGVVGVTETVNGFCGWIEKCGQGLEAKKSRFTQLYAPFPGFGEGTPLPAPLVTGASTTATLKGRDIKRLFKEQDHNKAIEAAVDLFFSELEHLATNKNVDVLVCAPPTDLWTLMDRDVGGDDDDEDEAPSRTDFHDLLKARGLTLPCPIQLVWPPTYTGKPVERKRRKGGTRAVKRELQDEATRAWNIYVGLYYKAKGVPWRLIRDPAEYDTCFVGVSFYNSLDKATIQTSVAQVFNERGEGIILNGGPAEKKDDRQIHLDEQGAYDLLIRSLEQFRKEHKRTPARVVLHKVSAFSEEEEDGFWSACDEQQIGMLELVHVRSSATRLFRPDYHAPLRGSFVSLDKHNNVLYTRGSIEFYQTYPGLYVPTTVTFDVHEEGDPLALAREILSLTKMSWNNTQIDNLMPVTLEASRKVSALLKYADEKTRTFSYRYFM